jgi:hypothetical protein
MVILGLLMPEIEAASLVGQLGIKSLLFRSLCR